MPLTDASQFGTNANRTQNETYCHFCFRDGTFTQKCTMDEMIENCLNYLDEFNRDSPYNTPANRPASRCGSFSRT